MTTSLLACRLPISLSFALGALVGAAGPVAAQPDIAPQNDAPNPYTTVRDWTKLPAGREWGAHSRFPGHALTPTGVMAIRCKQFHLPDL